MFGQEKIEALEATVDNLVRRDQTFGQHLARLDELTLRQQQGFDSVSAFDARLTELEAKLFRLLELVMPSEGESLLTVSEKKAKTGELNALVDDLRKAPKGESPRPGV